MPAGKQAPGTGTGGGSRARPGGQKSGAPSGTGGGGTSAGDGRQCPATIDLKTSDGATKTGTYRVPKDSVFGLTDIVVTKFQREEGALTITFGERKITTIAPETLRNQDYHWVTPIKIPENDTVTVEVACAKPGTPATGRRAQEYHEALDVSGVLSRTKR